MTEDDELLPEVFVRMVPGQVDDVLVAAPDLDKWGFDPHVSADRFLLHQCGLSVPRESLMPVVQERSSHIGECTEVCLREAVVLAHLETVVAKVCARTSSVDGQDLWMQACDSYMIAPAVQSGLQTVRHT